MKIKITLRRLMNNEKELGAVVTANVGKPTNAKEKANIENILINYAFDELYKGEGLSIHSDIHSDFPSIAIIRDINTFPYEELSIGE